MDVIGQWFNPVVRKVNSNFYPSDKDVFNFLPFKLQLSIRTVKFLQRFSASENLICSLSLAIASNQLNRLFSEYGDRFVSVCQFINAIHARNE